MPRSPRWPWSPLGRVRLSVCDGGLAGECGGSLVATGDCANAEPVGRPSGALGTGLTLQALLAPLTLLAAFPLLALLAALATRADHHASQHLPSVALPGSAGAHPHMPCGDDLPVCASAHDDAYRVDSGIDQGIYLWHVQMSRRNAIAGH